MEDKSNTHVNGNKLRLTKSNMISIAVFVVLFILAAVIVLNTNNGSTQEYTAEAVAKEYLENISLGNIERMLYLTPDYINDMTALEYGLEAGSNHKALASEIKSIQAFDLFIVNCSVLNTESGVDEYINDITEIMSIIFPQSYKEKMSSVEERENILIKYESNGIATESVFYCVKIKGKWYVEMMRNR